MKRRYATLDVFTGQPLKGNALAVVLDSQGLDTPRMQAIAREFNLSETVFVAPADNPMHSAAIRIFTPAYEMRFAGHPTVGTAVLLALLRAREAPGQQEMVIVLEEEVGPIRCGVFARDDSSAHGIFDLPVLPKAVEHDLNREVIAGALGLTSQEIGFENHQPSKYDAGIPYNFVPVPDFETLAGLEPTPTLWRGAFGDDGAAVYVYCRHASRHDRDFRARMFAPSLGFSEDPATGSAVAAFAGAVFGFDALPSGAHRIMVEQGIEMGRPSEITLEIDVLNGTIDAARIGGDAVLVAEGTLDI
jgi:trans-2,3-dihydro-3-hydroxyanthranilate isomerase